MKNTTQTFKVLFWSTIAVIDIGLILDGGLCFAIVGTAVIAYIYYLAAPLIISFIEQKMKNTFLQNQILIPIVKSLEETIISALAKNHLMNVLLKAFYVVIFLIDISLLYVVIKDKQSLNEIFRFHLAVLSYFIIMPICLSLSWTLYLFVLTLTMFVLYFKFLLPLAAVLVTFVVGVFFYTIYRVFVDNQNRIGTLSLKLSLMPLILIGSFYSILIFGDGREGIWWIFTGVFMSGISFSVILFVVGILMKIAGLVRRKSEYL